MLLKDAGKLNAMQIKWFATKPIEELYDTDKAHYQFNNLIKNPAYNHKQAKLKLAYDKWMAEVGDLHVLTNLELRNKMWGNNTAATATSKPALVKVNGACIIKFQTQGAFISYILTPKTGKTKVDGNAYKVYHYGIMALKDSDEINIQAQRIGYSASQIIINIKK
jgi:N-sulfoglucosamine sulfohydrolase